MRRKGTIGVRNGAGGYRTAKNVVRRYARRFVGTLLAAVFLVCPTMPSWADETATASDAVAAVVIEYENLSELVWNSQDLKDATENYTTNKSNYETLIAQLEDERDYMRLLADQYEDTEDEAQYKSSANAITSTLTQLRKRLATLNRRANSVSTSKTVDSYIQAAQTLMIAYNQAILNAEAAEKSAEAAEASYHATVNKQSAGMATAAEVLEAADTMQQQKNMASSYRQQAASARFALLSQFDLTDSDSVTIGTVPAPDLDAIASADLVTDVESAVNNNSSVQSARKSGSGDTYAQEALLDEAEAQTEASVRSSFADLYQQLQAARLTYESALDTYESAAITWQSAQLKQQAGMYDNTAWLEAQADYQQALADKESASMDLVQQWENYCWTVQGVG
ncbi:MAG: TolC family protein [Clostridiales bacterium]|nr:TolC family protein [Clostridiales bacterium]